MKGRAAVLALALAGVVAIGCATARTGPYRGPNPAPGAITAFDPRWEPGVARESKAGAPPFLVPGTTNRRRHDIGTVMPSIRTDSTVILVYGDNRPGIRLMTTPWGLPAVLGIGGPSPMNFIVGAVNIPVLLIQGIVPKLDIFRDALSIFRTHRYSGGGERQVAKAIERQLPADFVVNTGDLVEDGRRGIPWEDYVRIHTPLRLKVPYLAAPGNHERLWSKGGAGNWDAVMGPPAEPGKYWFAADLPDSVARFVFLDSELLADPKDHYPDSLQMPLAREQIRWADSTLAVPARWRFVVLHHPLVTSGHYLSDWKYDDSSPAELRLRGQLLEICRRRRVTAVLAGHEHLYQRTFIRGRGRNAGYFWHITTGGGGSPLYRLTERERKAALAVTLPDSSSVTWSRERTMYHYCKLILTRRPNPVDDTAFLVVHQVRKDGSIVEIDRVDLEELPPAQEEERPAATTTPSTGGR